MKSALPETKYIFDQLMDDEQKYSIEVFLNGLQEERVKYETSSIWELDQKIGGVGGYCMPADPKKNPFPGGIDRELFRPLQYARTEIDSWALWLHSRYVVHTCGMHLEAVMKLFLKNTKTFGTLRFNTITLGQAVHKIAKMNIVDEKFIDVLFKFVAIYNKAKHEVNMSDERPRLFAPSDAIVCYFCARIIGQMMLEKTNHEISQGVYEINTELISYIR